MVHPAHGHRALLFSVLSFAAVAGCDGLGDRKNDASQADWKVDDDALRTDAPAVGLSPLDGQPLFHDSTPIHVDADHVPPDAGSGLAATDADNAEASSNTDTDTTPPLADAGQAPETTMPSTYTVVVLPDTQYYASTYPDVFTSQTSWIVEQKAALNIAAVLHVGDIVDDPNSAAQWTIANSAMRQLDHLVPYVVVPGNHDTDGSRNGLIDSYFGPASMPWITSTMNPGQIENNFALIDIGPQQWLVLGLEFGPRDTVITWANAVLKAYPDRPAIIVTHAYLYSDGNRYDIAVSGSDTTQPNYQYWIPQYYGYTASQGINDGEMIWQKLIVPNPNVRMVFSGHVTGWARSSSTRPDGSVVHQMLSDYQWYRTDQPDYYGGGGYLRVVKFNYGQRTIQVQSYSPYLDKYLTDDANQFSLEMQP